MTGQAHGGDRWDEGRGAEAEGQRQAGTRAGMGLQCLWRQLHLRRCCTRWIVTRVLLSDCMPCPHAPHIPHTLPTLCLRHLERYGCTKWTDEALDVIKQYSPLIEIGAGHGHWQKALEDKGADVVAFDNEASLPIQGLPNVGKVQKGDEKDVRKCVGLGRVQKEVRK